MQELRFRRGERRPTTAARPLLKKLRRVTTILLLASIGCATGARTRPSMTRFDPPLAEASRKQKLATIAPELDAVFADAMVGSRSTALSAGIVLDGELVYTKGLGSRVADARAPVDVDTVFRIASLTKSFTASAVIQLRDRGQLRLDEAAATYLPGFRNFVGLPKDAAAITVRQLLTNASGLPNDDYWGPVTFGWKRSALEGLLTKGITLGNAPGQRYAYSNLGFAILGQIVERVSGAPFRAYVTENLLRPLGMNATVWESAAVPTERLAVGYRREGDQLITEPRPPDGIFDAAGGLYTSMRDYARYVGLQVTAYPPRDDAETGPLRRSSVREMHVGQRWARWRGEETPIVSRGRNGLPALTAAAYGYGWLNNTTCEYEGIVQHGGFEPGYFAAVQILPRHRISFAAFSTGGAAGAIAFEKVLALLSKAGLLDDPASERPELEAARRVVDRLMAEWEPTLVAQAFDPQSLRYSYVGDLRERLARLTASHGRCRAAGRVRSAERTSGTWRAECARGSVDVTLFLSPEAPPRIQTVEWKESGPEARGDAGNATTLCR